MSFMQPQIYKGQAWVCETSHGTEVVPADLVSADPSREELAQFCEGTVESSEKKSGYLARMSAAGYMDCTHWEIHDTVKEARASLEESYGDDEG